MITTIFAPPGNGKSCALSLIAQKELKRISKGKSQYKYVFTNYPCKGTYKIKVEDLGRFYVHDALIILDEVTMELDSRDWKKVSKGLVEFIVTHRHLNCSIVAAVQDFSRMEKTLRENCTDLYFLSRSPVPFFRRWAHCRQIFRKLTVNEYSSELVLGYRFSDWVDRLFRQAKYRSFYLPKAYGLFDSWDTYGLDKRIEKGLDLWLEPAGQAPTDKEKK